MPRVVKVKKYFRFLKPTKVNLDSAFRFSSIFPSIQGAIKKREQSLQEYNKCQGRVDKYQDRDRTGQNVVKLDAVSALQNKVE